MKARLNKKIRFLNLLINLQVILYFSVISRTISDNSSQQFQLLTTSQNISQIYQQLMQPAQQIQSRQSQITKPHEQPAPDTYFQLIQKVGSNGKYQKILLLIFCLIWYVTGTILLGTGFLFLNPSFDCPSFGLITDNCYDFVCALNSDQWQDFIATDSANFKSLANGFDQRFYCSDQVYLNLYSTLPYFGAFIGYIIISYYADNKGRKNITILGWAVSIVGVIMVVAAPNITVASVGMFLAGLGTDSGTNISMIFMVQVFEDGFRQKSMAAIQPCFTAGGLLTTLFYFLFKDFWITTLYCTLIPLVITLVLMLVYLQQSPMFLVRQGLEPAYKALNNIGKLNKGQDNCIPIQDIQNVMQKQQVQEFNRNITFLDLFRFESLRIVTICAGIASVSTYLMYYGPILIVGQIGFDIYTTNLVLNMSDLLTYYPLYLIIDKIKRKKTSIILLAVAAAISVILIFVVVPSDCNGICSTIIVQLAMVFVFRFCISMQFAVLSIYTAELYPTRARSIGGGIQGVFGTIASSSSPLIMGAITRAQINPFILFAMMGLIGMASYTFLNETYQQVLPDEIEQIEYEKAKRRSIKQNKASLHKSKET